MMKLVLIPLFAVLARPARCREEGGGYDFGQDIRQLAVAAGHVYVATDDGLHQLSHDLRLEQPVSLSGVWKAAGVLERVSEANEDNATFRVHVLLPFVKNGTLITCGVIDTVCEYCEIRNLTDISEMVYWEQFNVGPQWRSSASVAIVVDVTKNRGPTETYILSAEEHPRQNVSGSCSDTNTLRLMNTNDKQYGNIFSIVSNSENAAVDYKGSGNIKFVDGFQIGAAIYFILSQHSITREARLLWFEGNKGKRGSLENIRGGILARTQVVASSLVPGVTPVLWVGVFAVDGGETNTQLVLFDISSDLVNRTEIDAEFPFRSSSEPAKHPLRTLTPEAVVFRQNGMTAVLAVRQRAWTVFFIGTDDGQVIKLAVDNNYNSPCPSVLYRANGDQKVFPKIHLDEVDGKHIYVPFQKQIKRMPVARCGNYATVEDCWSAQDPYCVWCVSSSRCTYEDDCRGSDWLSIPDDFQQKMISLRVVEKNRDEIELVAQTHVSVSQSPASNLTCWCTANSVQLDCVKDASPPPIPQCKCTLPKRMLPAEGLRVRFNATLWTTDLSKETMIYNCSNLIGPHTSSHCLQCLEAGCGWSDTGCTWANHNAGNVSLCQTLPSRRNFSSTPVIFSVHPSNVSFYGKNQAKLTGSDLSDVIMVRIRADMDCKPWESPVRSNTGDTLTFHIPRANNKGTAKVCVLLADGTCHGNATINYRSAPSCNSVTPNSSWFSGSREITLTGSHLHFVDAVAQSHAPHKLLTMMKTESQNLTFKSAQGEFGSIFPSGVHLLVANHTLNCSKSITYYPDPEFINFTTTRSADSVVVIIQKKADNLDISLHEVSVWGVQRGNNYKCDMEKKETTNETDFFTCNIEQTSETTFQKLKITYGDKEVFLTAESSSSYSMLSLFFFAPIPIIIICTVVVIFYRRKQKMLAVQMDKRLEELELDIRNDIRQGFVDLQTENADLLENVGAIPFLDYKHFAAKIFFPESESMMASCIKDIGQDVVPVQLDQASQAMSRLIHNKLFLTSMVHALEEQKSFGIKDKCVFASLLTVALHSDLPYLTEVMETLLCDLMHQRGATQPKLLLRRTESIVEKLLTNWMSICLYGFLRETVGQHLFLIVSALTQQTARGPVDCVTEKALYTLSEDWLLWQAQDFAPLKLKVLFAVGCDGEVSEPLEVSALNCDTVEQLKGKILASFKNKFGFPYCTHIRELCVEYQKNGSFVLLQEVDASSVSIGEVTMLNTLKHYQIPDGATVKVLSQKTHPPLSPQGSLKDDENFSGKYFHLIDPEDVEDQKTNPERKKLKLKEVHLTKLLSTKVAVHSFVENLFKSIWGATHCKVPLAVKHFFDFLDAQADNMKVNDPDVLHIWKTNSLPLRYWVNIIKNPQFVFDMEKTAHLDGCLSVIAQAFMDSFSLSDTQLGKYAPTNKLLYAKDIPKFKQEVKSYYKQIRDQSPISPAEFKTFLLEESKKHENEFNQAVALKELHKFIQCYFPKIKDKLDQNGAPAELAEQLHHVKTLFDEQRSCSWN